MKKALCLIAIVFLLNACTVQEVSMNKTQESFCGTSTKDSCASNSDCIAAGCSGQICQSSSEEQAISTCEYRDCYDETIYDLSCSCVENSCQWA